MPGVISLNQRIYKQITEEQLEQVRASPTPRAECAPLEWDGNSERWLLHTDGV